MFEVHVEQGMKVSAPQKDAPHCSTVSELALPHVRTTSPCPEERWHSERPSHTQFSCLYIPFACPCAERMRPTSKDPAGLRAGWCTHHAAR